MELGWITCMVHIIKHTLLTYLAKVLKGVDRLFYKRSGSSCAWASELERGAKRAKAEGSHSVARQAWVAGIKPVFKLMCLLTIKFKLQHTY